MPTDPSQESNDIASLLKKNIALSEQILYHAKKTHHHLMWDTVFSAVKWLIILAPIALAAWYFPKIAKDTMSFAGDIGKQFEMIQKQFDQLGELQKQAGQMQQPRRK